MSATNDAAKAVGGCLRVLVYAAFWGTVIWAGVHFAVKYW